MRYWWVNQNQTYKSEIEGGYLWSPKTNKNGGKNQFYDNMELVSAGDIVFSFCDTIIKAVGVAQDTATTAAKPDFGNVGNYWQNEGWLVQVEFEETENPVRPKDIINELKPHLASKYAPLQANGNGNQGVYLAEVSQNFAKVIIAKLGIDPANFDTSDETTIAVEEEQEQADIQGRTDIGATQKSQLIKARRGQGIFRANVRLNEKKCRVTGVTDPIVLVASHIKPWSKSSDFEKLDGCNGLLLSPHVDRLFDKGLISFADNGGMIVSPRLSESVLAKWQIDPKADFGSFSSAQAAYLQYHRLEVFKK